MNPQFLMRVEHLALSFGGVHAVRDVSFDLRRGEVLAIIGPNGAGKTSVFNLLTRVIDADAGTVTLDDGTDLMRVARHQVVHAGVARTFQNVELFDGATVRDNLLLGRHRFVQPRRPLAALMHLVNEALWTPRLVRGEEAAREHVERIIDLLGLAMHRNSLVATLPYGVRKVVELGRALAAEPRMLLLDEPASGLNPEETRDLGFWIDDIRHDLGISVLMIEHDMSLVSAVADRVLCMNLGRVLTEGTVAQVRAHPEVLAAYLGHATAEAA